MGFQQRADSGFRGERPKFREFCRNFLAPHYIRRIHHSTTIHGLRAVVIHVRHSFTSHMVIHAVYIPVYIPYQSIRLFQQRDLTSHPEISEQYLNSTVRGRPVWNGTWWILLDSYYGARSWRWRLLDSKSTIYYTSTLMLACIGAARPSFPSPLIDAKLSFYSCQCPGNFHQPYASCCVGWMTDEDESDDHAYGVLPVDCRNEAMCSSWARPGLFFSCSL
jgi:hypothetical protein